ncbi:Putative acyl-CoA dehydrogenase AidB [Microbulbifer aggregans]|uniref:Acyl-CoA dehydrogenase AidB n=1 Tax=Microbulbifer aggregans TaxID=1769779 RepID=A0A1C9WBQ0_9GAMM|nr:acyl-CoA dehydrogenase [Microbulbifer aggregans]AOS98576.1 Putative acyl-CoA dehydrogenase AidB [Microbulbifer aggregans]
MDTPLLNERDIEFLLYEFLDTESLLERPRYREHSREIFNATLQTARTVAEKHFANHNAKGDANEPRFDGERVHLIPETQQAWDSFAEAGFLAAHCDEEEGGLQLPEVILRTALAYISAANVASAAYPFLTIGAANLVRSFASADLKARFLGPMLEGRFSGTMALTEPDQGSALGDLRTTATPADDGSYRLRGQKMYISGGDHTLTENIVHMVLARIEGAPAGVKGISLFLVPKFLVNELGEVGERNDVQLAGLLHKMGYRNTTSTVLSFGERDGAVGYLVGEPHRGLSYMFQMMNEARIGVGMGATVLGYQGYNHALNYARSRPQGRLPSNRDPLSAQVPIIRHADVRRMLLAQKSYVEGAMALCLYASSLHEDQQTAADAAQRKNAAQLLDLLTPVVKSWPSRYGVVANDLAIQVLGGAGYIREYPLEQLYRDNRLNPIHEGTEGIQALDLLGRKVPAGGLAGYQLLQGAIRQTLVEARDCQSLGKQAEALEQALQQLDETTLQLMGQLQADADRGLANASLYLDAFGRVVLAWIWLRQALAAQRGLTGTLSESEQSFYRGKLQAARYFSEWELPQIGPQLALLSDGNGTPYEMEDAWF